MDLTKPMPNEFIVGAILFFIVSTLIGVFVVKIYRRKS